MFDNNWNHILIEKVFPVCVSEKNVGKRSRTFGTTKFYQLGIKFEGETEIYYNKEKITFSAGNVLYLPKEKREDIPYNKTFIKSSSGVCIFFNSDHPLYDQPLLFHNCSSAEYLFRQICNSYAKGNTFKTLSLFYEILSALSEKNSKKSKLNRATTYITEHIDEPFIDLDVLAQRCGVSRDYFRHLFTKTYGVSPTQYIAEQKITRIKNKLLTSDQSIREISFLCGFFDENYFSRFFKKHTGLTPNEFRKKYMAMY